MLTERLAILVSANVDGAVRGLQKIEKEADKSLGATERRIDRMGAGFTKAGAVMLTAGGLMAVGMWKAGQAASDLNEAVNQSEQIFGSAADEISSFAEGATAIGQSNRAAREAVNTFGLLFTNIGKSESEAADMSQTMTTLASDMASFKNTTPEEAVEALGSAMRGEMEPIRRYGVMLDDATLRRRAFDMGLTESVTGVLPPAIKAQAAYAEILEQTTTIQGDYGRTADDPANAQRRLRAEVEDTTAAIGQAMLPVMRDGIGVLNDVTGAFNNLPSPVQSTISKLAVATTGFMLAGGAAASVVGQVIKMRDVFQKIPPAATRMAGAIGAATVAVAMYASMVDKANRFGDMFRDQATDVLQGAVSFRHFQAELSNVTTQINNLDDAIAGSQAPWDADKRMQMSEQRDALREVANGYSEFIPRVRELSDEFGITEDQALALLQRQQELGLSAEDTESQIAGLNDSLTTEQSAALADQLGVTSDQLTMMTGATEDATDAQEELFKAMDAVIDQAFGGMNAIADWEEGLDELAASARENGTSLDLTTEAGRRNHRLMEDLVRAGNDRIQQLIDEGASTDEVRTAQWLMASQLEATAGELGFNAQQAGVYRDALNSIPRTVHTTVNIEEIINRQKVTNAGGPGADRYRARGGPVMAGQSYVVGEEGPELLTMAGNGFVHPNGSNAMANAASGGGGGGDIHVHLNVPNGIVGNKNEVGRWITDALDTYARHNGLRAS